MTETVFSYNIQNLHGSLNGAMTYLEGARHVPVAWVSTISIICCLTAVISSVILAVVSTTKDREVPTSKLSNLRNFSSPMILKRPVSGGERIGHIYLNRTAKKQTLFKHV